MSKELRDPDLPRGLRQNHTDPRDKGVQNVGQKSRWYAEIDDRFQWDEILRWIAFKESYPYAYIILHSPSFDLQGEGGAV